MTDLPLVLFFLAHLFFFALNGFPYEQRFEERVGDVMDYLPSTLDRHCD